MPRQFSTMLTAPPPLRELDSAGTHALRFEGRHHMISASITFP
jgi:hypothetical protein